mmetsp:Transcript_29040/g.94853  ORF Transcript_29040/g.94853 Transcript_29040/m.94853 type:complete len:220 (+) Transcript_29040:73-732(+)|eukprot:CAMPEP_0170144088 /NCGR_PEP_ID=MMETSP0033_2-20121228/13295_1 /TAXON_ID=195969 /ORGANISM="Dolichomastix tenuilepis, Strain CCMP3274" /LENGTH=219 /DNA_ID=CAMNT_0010380569 /DNA_START=53 /DNA_END=712 /DNA_ORIENTATION=+
MLRAAARLTGVRRTALVASRSQARVLCRCAPAEVKEAPAAEAAPEPALHEALEIRVGRITKAWKHPEADKLYVEEVDCGEEELRTICSGLVPYIAEEEMQDREVLVLCNLKARNMVGIKSNGMLLAASDEAHESVELIAPPAGVEVGERVKFGDWDAAQADPFAPNKLQKKKVWEKVMPTLCTTEDKVVAIKGEDGEILPMQTSVGPVTAATLANGTVG